MSGAMQHGQKARHYRRGSGRSAAADAPSTANEDCAMRHIMIGVLLLVGALLFVELLVVVLENTATR